MAPSMVESTAERRTVGLIGVTQSATFTTFTPFPIATTTAMLGTTTRLAVIQFQLAEHVPLVSLIP